jgi:phosphatidylglycerophosphate synthase
MYKSKLLRTWLARGHLLPLFKKLGIRPEPLVVFRIVFAIASGFSIMLLDWKYSIIVLTVYQFVFLLDYIDGELAKHFKAFSLRWNLLDRIAHYVVSAFFLFAVTLRFAEKGPVLWIGLLGSSFILLNLAIEQFGLMKKRVRLDNLRGQPEEQGMASPIYSFLPIDGPFTIFYILFLARLYYPLVVFYGLLYTITLIKKIVAVAKK